METEEKMLSVRSKVAKEIVQTEITFVKALKTLVTVRKLSQKKSEQNNNDYTNEKL